MKLVLIALVALLAVVASKKICEPSSQFKNYCNRCTCSADGTYFACTKMYCDKGMWNEDGSLKIVLQAKNVFRKGEKQVCTPNSQFTKQCNTCICSNDGLSEACTTMTCDEQSTNFISPNISEQREVSTFDAPCPPCNCECNCF